MKNKAIKIIVPVLMVAVVAGIWFFQNQGNNATVSAEGEIPLNVSSVDIASLSENEFPMIIDFGADECIPCKEMAPVLVSLNQEMQGKAIIQFVDVWKNPDAASAFPIQVIPTQIIVNSDGSPYVPNEELGLEFMMYADSETGEHSFTTHQGGLTEEQMRLILSDMGVE